MGKSKVHYVHYFICLLSFVIAFTLDALTKYFTHAYIYPYRFSPYPYGGISVFKNWMGIEFSIVHATNKGMAWGLLSGMPQLLLWGRLGLIGAMLFYLWRVEMAFRMRLALVIVVAGALGNVVDAFLYGHVIDMFKFVLWGYHFPVFNVADTTIFCGVSFLFLNSLFGNK